MSDDETNGEKSLDEFERPDAEAVKELFREKTKRMVEDADDGGQLWFEATFKGSPLKYEVDGNDENGEEGAFLVATESNEDDGYGRATIDTSSVTYGSTDSEGVESGFARGVSAAEPDGNDEESYPQTLARWTETDGVEYRLLVTPSDGSEPWAIMKEYSTDGGDTWKRMTSTEATEWGAED